MIWDLRIIKWLKTTWDTATFFLAPKDLLHENQFCPLIITIFSSFSFFAISAYFSLEDQHPQSIAVQPLLPYEEQETGRKAGPQVSGMLWPWSAKGRAFFLTGCNLCFVPGALDGWASELECLPACPLVCLSYSPCHHRQQLGQEEIEDWVRLDEVRQRGSWKMRQAETKGYVLSSN